MNENLDKLIIEGTKFLKLARMILILWVIFYVLAIILSIAGFGGIAYQRMMMPQ
jgi:hypothetical protein